MLRPHVAQSTTVRARLIVLARTANAPGRAASSGTGDPERSRHGTPKPQPLPQEVRGSHPPAVDYDPRLACCSKSRTVRCLNVVDRFRPARHSRSSGTALSVGRERKSRMWTGLMPSNLQWCRCGRFRGPNLAESVAVRRRFRAGVRAFCQKLIMVELRTGAPTVGSGGGSVAFASGLSPAPLVTFPVPAHRTVRADFPHTALGRDHSFAHGRLAVRRARRVRPMSSHSLLSGKRTKIPDLTLCLRHNHWRSRRLACWSMAR